MAEPFVWDDASAIEELVPPGLGDDRSFSTAPQRRRALSEARLARLQEVEDEVTEKLACVLDNRVERVAILSRAGSDLSRHRFRGETPRYTHSGLVVRTATGWQMRHVLNTHGGAEGHLRRQPLCDFAKDDPWKYRFEVLVLTEGMQNRLASALSTSLPNRIHRTAYSAIAHPRSRRYQQCNQWLLEFVAASGMGRPGVVRSEAQRWLAVRRLRPSIIQHRALAGWVGQWIYGAFSRNLHFDDHPAASRARGDFAFISSTTVRDFMAANGWLVSRAEVFAGVPLGGHLADKSVIGAGDL